MDSELLWLLVNICGVDLEERWWFVGEGEAHELPPLAGRWGVMRLIREEESQFSLEKWPLVDKHIAKDALVYLVQW